MDKAMLSQPMAGKTQEDVIREVLSTVRMPLAGA